MKLETMGDFSTKSIEELNQTIKELTQEIEIDPQNAELYVQRGKFYRDLRNCPEALEDYSKAIELDPMDWEIYYHRAYIYGLLWQTKEALEDYDKAIELNPTDWGIYYHRAYIYRMLEQPKKALDDYNKVIELNPLNSQAYQFRADLCTYDLQLNQPEEVLEDYDKAIELDSTDFVKYHHRANIYHILNQHEKELEDRTRAIEFQSCNFSLYVERARVYAQLGQTERAVEDYNKGIGSNSEEPWMICCDNNEKCVLALLNRPRYARVFGLCRLLGIKNIYDIGCGINGQATLLAACPDIFYTGIDCASLKEVCCDSASKLFADYCDERIKFQQGMYPFAITPTNNNIAICLGFPTIDPAVAVGDRKNFCNAIERDFERVLLQIDCENFALAETELTGFELYNIEYTDNFQKCSLVFGTKFPDEISVLKEINYCFSEDMDSIRFFAKKLISLQEKYSKRRQS